MNEQFTAIIVDDESKARSNLKSLIEDYCPEIAVLDDFEKPSIALAYLIKNDVDLIFLDIQMPEMSGLDLLKGINNWKGKAIIVSAYDSYGIDAVKSGAFDYILKPIGITELRAVIERVVRASLVQEKTTIEDKSDKDYKLTVPHSHGFKLIDLRTVIHIKSDNSYCVVTFEDGKTFIVTRGIKEFEISLHNLGFFRIHNKFLINLAFLETFTLIDGGVVTMINGDKFPVSRRRLKEFKQLTDNQFNSLG